MTANPFPFKVLFCFENESKILIEIKRTDIQSEDKSRIYKWLIIRKQNENENENLIGQLTFQSMEQTDGEQVRQFSEGTLIWDADQATFNDEAMKPVKAEEVSEEWLEIIARTT